MSEHESVKMSDHESLERLRRNRSNLGFQSATGRTRRGEPDRSCRLPSPPVGRTRPVASLLVRDQAGCPFDETGKMPVLLTMRPYEKFAQAAKILMHSGTKLRDNAGFTLAELVLSVGVLVLLVLLTAQLLNSAATIMTLGHRQMNADSEARELFDRMAIDFAQMVRRSDVDYYLKSSTTASDCTLCNRQRGNDQIAFYSIVPGWSALTGAQQSPVSIIGYRIHVSEDTFSNRIERLGEGLVWNGAASDTRGDDRPASVLFWAPLNPWATTTNTPFDIISPDVFRFEYYYLLKNGDLSSTPWHTISSVRGMQDVSAIIVDIAVLDPKSRVLLTNSDITELADELPDYGGQAPGGLLAGWRTALDANRTLPRRALSNVRLYERCFHLSATAL